MPFNGKFWPIVCPKWWSDPQTDTPGGVSVHFLDPYSLVHIQVGKRPQFFDKKVAVIRKYYLEIHFFSDGRNIILFDGLSSKVHPGQVLL